VFAVYRIDEQLAKAMDRKVWLPSGGTLVIDRTEAMTVVDVNTGKFTGAGGNLEQTVTKNNLEAAEETVRQLRLRDIGGIVVIDFIDMVLESNRDLVLRRLTEALARDRTRHQVSEVTSLGLVQLTRKRLGTGLIEAFSTNCSECSGRGIVVHADPVDNASANGDSRRAESTGGRRGRRGKKGRGDEPAVARVPAHTPGEHPMFKAMAATTAHDGEDDPDESLVEENLAEIDVERSLETGPVGSAVDLAVTDDGEVDDEDDEDEDDELDPLDDHALDEDDDDLDADDADDDEDDEDDDDDEDDEDGDEDFDDDDEDDEDDEDGDDGEAAASAPLTAPGRSRRRAAARPAGPPVSDI
jgi:ribonuclease E